MVLTVQTRSVNLDDGWKRLALIAVCALAAAAALVFAKWAFGHAVAVNAAETEVAALGVGLAPDDPHAHFGLAQQLEKTLLPGDEEHAFREYEAAVALSPNNYVFWLGLGRARERSGDAAGAERALRKAAELAPNYSRVQWALGNNLLRQGRQDEAFTEIRRAVAADRTFASPAAAAAWQIFAGDVGQIRPAIGDSPQINGAVAVLLAGDKRFPEAIEFWRLASGSEDADAVKEARQAVYNKLIEAGLYRSALEVDGSMAVVGAVSNGNFEAALTGPGTGSFSWAVADGTFPRVGLNESQKRSGNYSLLISFGQGGKGFRQVSQKVGVEPLQNYSLQFFYRSELTTTARIRCDVFSAAGNLLAGTTLTPTKQEWAEAGVPFAVPAGVEGIEIRIGIEGCPDAGCVTAGNIWFDDLILVKR